MTSRVIFPSKLVAETKALAFDFTSQLTGTATVNTATVTCAVWSGTDATPANVISGVATVNSPVVTQLVTAGVAGVLYLLTCTAVTSDGQTLTMTGFLSVLPAQP